MKTVALTLFSLFSLLGLLSAADKPLIGKAEEESYEGRIVLIKVGQKDLMVGQSFKFWERTLERAEAEGAKAVIFDLDTPGGLAFPTKELMSIIANLDIPTRAYVNPSALSAGALISVATDKIYMKPGSVIGSAGIINGSGQGMDETARAKVESFFDAHVRWIAEKQGHDPEVIRGMMIRRDEDRTYGDVTVEKGGLLALNSADAVKIQENGPLLAEAEVDSLTQLLLREGWEEDLMVEATPSGFEKLAWWVASVSGLLIMVGLAGGYFELKTPGFGLGGIVSLAAFTIFFFGNYLAGNLAGYELVAVFVLGLVLIAVEIFIIPGFGLPGITGLIMVVGSLIFSMVDGAVWRGYDFGSRGFTGFFDALSGPALQLSLGIFGSIILLYLIMKFLPQLGFMKKVMLPETQSTGTGMNVAGETSHRVGATGTALTDLRPAGKVLIEGEELDVCADDQFIPKGEAIRIISEDGMGVVVTREH